MIDRIIEAAAEHYGVTPEEVRGRSRKRKYVLPRQAAMYLARKHTYMTLRDIGEEFGGRDHTTVMHAIDVVVNDLDYETSIGESVQEIEENIHHAKETQARRPGRTH